MRILLLMDPGLPVPPKLYGGHERLVYLFAEEYQKSGHEVTLLAGPNSFCSGHTVTFGINELNRSGGIKFKEVVYVWKYLLKNYKNFDLIHNFGRLIYLLPILNRQVKKIMTYGRPVTKKGIMIINFLPNRNLVFTGCSDYCVSTGNIVGRWKTVYNAIDFSQYQLNEVITEDAPLMFLGRVDRIKGVHTAIKIAKATANKLIIGGNVSQNADNYKYFKTEIEPLIDNEQIIYLGALNDAEKNTWLRQSKALLFPIEWDEPFGIVMIEAMACGTPVIAFNRGAVPEVVDLNKSGFIAESEENMVHYIEYAHLINRTTCRQVAQKRFDVTIIAQQYLDLFK